MLEEVGTICMSAIPHAHKHRVPVDPDTWAFSETTSEYKVSVSHL